MFLKLIVLILSLGSTGVGVLSVRQSRLVASNEMTQSRMRSRDLDRRAMEYRSRISESITPDLIRGMMGEGVDSLMIEQTLRRVDLLGVSGGEDVGVLVDDTGAEMDSAESGFWVLDDGTRVYLIDAED